MKYRDLFSGLLKLSVLLALINTTALLSEVKLPKLLSDGMVLQRNTKVKIWGWASPDENIIVQFMNKTYKTIANKNGEWSVYLLKLKAGGPHSMTIEGTNKITISDIMIGDVWVCSGQSNMETTMLRVSPIYEKEIANSENPNIRYFEVPDDYNFSEPLNNLKGGKWVKPDPKVVLNFSAICYFFADEFYKKYKVPVGMINSAVGGSPAECWMSETALKPFPRIYDEAVKLKDTSFTNNIVRQDRSRINAWYRKLSETDKGYKGSGWYNPDTDVTSWDVMNIPGYWSDSIGIVNGVFWFRKDIELPASMSGKKAKLNLGVMIDSDSVYVNGVFVGTTGYQYPPRRYEVPSGILKEGNNTIVIRLINNIGKGGFVPDKPYEMIADTQKIDLRGEWKYRIGAKMEPLEGETFLRMKPLGLFNAMIAPLMNLSIKGVLWYQGESNSYNFVEYRKLFPALISDWREKWHQGNFPFLYVQLPNFGEAKKEPYWGNWCGLREAQLKTLSVPNTAMAVAIDVGEWNDIHPLRKKEIAHRLFLAAERTAYGNKSIVYSGPVFKSMEIKNGKCELTFDYVGGGLMAKGGEELKYFAIAGADSQFVWAKAKIENNKVIVWNDKIKTPLAVRYAWADNPESANLYNKEGLPASPFRTDEFEQKNQARLGH